MGEAKHLMIGKEMKEEKKKKKKIKETACGENDRRTIDILKRKLIKIGIYSAPIIASVSIPDIKIQAQTQEEEPPSGDLPSPIFRKKGIIEEERKERNEKIKRLKIKSIYENSKNLLKSPFKKSPLETKKEEK
jgi:hypothetical protein